MIHHNLIIWASDVTSYLLQQEDAAFSFLFVFWLWAGAQEVERKDGLGMMPWIWGGRDSTAGIEVSYVII